MDQQLTSIPALVSQRAASFAGETILRVKDRGIWRMVTWRQLEANVQAIGAALLAADFARGDVVAILSETRPEAVYADLAILGCGAASLAIDPDDEADVVCHKLSSSGSRQAFVENEEQLDKILSIRNRCPALSRIVVFDMKGLRDFSDANCIALHRFIETGGTADWTAAAKAVTAEQPAVIQFPPGERSGMGLTLSHGDVAGMVSVAKAKLGMQPKDERLAVLRLSDITERIWGLYLALETRCISNYPEGPDTVIENLQELQPTVLGASAAVWDHLRGLATTKATGATRVQRLAYDWGFQAGRAGGSMARFADLLVLRAVRRECGLNRLRLAYVGGGSVIPASLEWARSLGVQIHRVDEPTVRSGLTDDERYETLMNEV